MRVLALEPYYGGSHQAFLEGWTAHSRHAWTLLSLPAYKWKWRMRHAAVTFAQQVGDLARAGTSWDLLFCSDMLSLAEFLGLGPPSVRQLPSVAYFHENQLTYPVRHETERDYHFALTNMTTALAATGVWFNSAYHRDAFLAALPAFLKRMPDFQPFDAVGAIRRKSSIQPQGVHAFPPRRPRQPGALRILWAARWEHDKNPGDFFAALRIIQERGVAFHLSVVGERFRETPPVFDEAHERFRDQIDRWGYQETRRDYEAALADADVIVSTAHHEFFGISVVEAVAAGAYPLVPQRLAYPEILADVAGAANDCLYAGGPEVLATRLIALADRVERGELWQGDATRGLRGVARFGWETLAPRLDDALEHPTETR